MEKDIKTIEEFMINEVINLREENETLKKEYGNMRSEALLYKDILEKLSAHMEIRTHTDSEGKDIDYISISSIWNHYDTVELFERLNNTLEIQRINNSI